MGQRLPRFDNRLATAVLVAGPPLALAIFLLFVGPVAARSVPGRRPLDTLALFLFAAAAISLVGWRSAPVVAFGASLAWTVLYVGLGYSPGPIYLAPFAGLLVLVATSPASTWVWAAIVSAAGLALARSASGWSPGILVFVVVWLVATGLFAAGVRVRRGFLAEVESRELYEARSREEERRRKGAEDRLRIARDVHDVVGHSLAVISLQAGVAEHLLRSRPEEAQRAVAAIRSVSKEALSQLRTELAQLRGEDAAAPITRPAPGLDDVPALVDSLRAAGVAVELEVNSAGRPVPEIVSAACYRIVQEALTNVARHAGPGTTAKVRLDATDDVLEVEILDDGPGSTSSNTDGRGLLGMRDRTTALGGRFETNNRAGKGFRVWAGLPLRAE
jgi:signal transduction histidine kinase